MAVQNIELNDEVFNIISRKIGVVINIKELEAPQRKKYVRVFIKNDVSDEIWAIDEIGLWNRKAK